MAQKMLKIGLTGGIGSGKSTAAACFAKLGVPVIDADLIVRELLEPGKAEFKAISKHFGERVISARGTLKRKILRRIIFNDAEEKRWLEKLLHPKVYAVMHARLKQIKYPYCILVIPLLFETKYPKNLIDRILVVDAYKSICLKRIMERDKTSKAMAEKIINNQVSRKIRLVKADDVLINNGSFDHLYAQVIKLHKKYLDIA